MYIRIYLLKVNLGFFSINKNKCFKLMSIFYKIDPRSNEPTGFFFASDDIRTADYLMIIIHGMGVVRAGQWSRKYFVSFVCL